VSINEWNSSFYTGYAIWCFILIAVTTIDIIWLMISMTPWCRHRRVKQFLQGGGYVKADREVVKDFTDELDWSKSKTHYPHNN